MKRVLITRLLTGNPKEILERHFQVDQNPDDQLLPKEALLAAMHDYDAILCTIPDEITATMLEQATRLKVISNCAIGLDNIDVEAAKKKGIAVYNLPDVVTNSTADLTFALFLAFIRKIPQSQEYVRGGHWKSWEPSLFLGEELNGKTYGIVGFGKIGQAVARRALGFGVQVIVYNRSPIKPSEELKPYVRQVSWEEMQALADYISFHVPLVPETRGMVNLEAMKKMQKKPVLINVARGGVIQTDDLVEALYKGYVRGAALDVTSPEPIPASHPLCMMENCMIIPHIGSATLECRTLMAKRAAENIIHHYLPKA